MQDPDDDAPRDPEVKKDDAQNGLICFMDQTRECGADCMAYISDVDKTSDTKDALGQQQRNCVLIVSAERLGRYLGGGVTLLKRALEKSDKEAADKRRMSHPPPPSPLGKT